MGRPRKPTALKVLHGDFAKNPQRRNQLEPDVPPGKPECPEWIVGEAREEWERITADLFSMNVLTERDRAAINAYCVIHDRWQKALAEINRSGLTLASKHGDYENPACKIAARCEDQMQRFLSKFGLTPADRSRVNIKEQTAPVRMRRVR